MKILTGFIEKMLASSDSLEPLAARLSNEYSNTDDRWQVQKLCQVLNDHEVVLVSSLAKDTIMQCKLGYAESIDEALKKELDAKSGIDRAAVVPYGPLFIPSVGNME